MKKKFKGITCVCMGDSLTSVIDQIVSSAETYWTYLVQLQTGIRMINKGIGGETSAQNLARFNTDVLSYSPKYCTIMTGANDIYVYFNTKTNTTEDPSIYTTALKNIDSMVQMCKDNDIIPLLATEPVGYWNPDHASVKDVETLMIENMRRHIMSYASENNVICLDLCDTAVYTDASYRYIYNIHPKPNGNAVIAEKWIELFDAIIADTPSDNVDTTTYGKLSTSLGYVWEGAYSATMHSSDMYSVSLTNKAANIYNASYSYGGESGVLFDAATGVFTAELSTKANNAYTMNYSFYGTGGTVTPSAWAMDGAEIVDGAVTMIADDSQAELDVINGEVV